MERLGRHERALLALEILTVYGPTQHYGSLTQDEIEEVGPELVLAARKVLLERARSVLEDLLALNFSNNQISCEVGFDEVTTSRARNHGHELTMSLTKLRELVESLDRFLLRARLEILHRLIPQGPVSLTVLDFCAPSSSINPDTSSEICRIVFANLIGILTNRLDNRLPLPKNIDGALVRCGPSDFGFFTFQIEGTSEIERLNHQIHELEHLVARKKAERNRKEREMATSTLSAGRKPKNRPKSAF